MIVPTGAWLCQLQKLISEQTVRKDIGMNRKETELMLAKVTKHRECMKAFVAGEQVQFRTVNMCAWTDAHSPDWIVDTEYRVKPGLRVTDLKVGQQFKCAQLVSSRKDCVFMLLDERNSRGKRQAVILDGWPSMKGTIAHLPDTYDVEIVE